VRALPCPHTLNVLDIDFFNSQSDTVASGLLEKCKKHYRTGFKKSPDMARALMQLDDPEKQRAEAQANARRFKGMTQEEKANELLKMTIEQKDMAEAAVAASKDDAAALKRSGSAHLELSMVFEQMQQIPAARDAVLMSVQRLTESVAAGKDQEAFNLLAIATNAVGMINDDPVEAKKHFAAARYLFASPIAGCICRFNPRTHFRAAINGFA
jgi:hypothetical protein